MWNSKLEIQRLKWLKRMKCIIQNVYHIIVLFDCKQTSIPEMYLRVQGYVPASPVVVYITMDEWAFTGIYTLACLTAENMDDFKFGFYQFLGCK